MARAKTIDQKGMGLEPTWVDVDNRSLAIGQALNWYNYYNGYKEAKQFICQYLVKQGKKDIATLVKKVKDYDVTKSIGWLVQMNHNGLELEDHEVKKIDNHIDELVQIAKGIQEEKAETKTSRPNVQEIMKERALELGGELEGLLDEYIKLGVPTSHKIKPITVLMESSVLPQHIKILIEGWEAHKNEFEEILKTEDKDLLEAYSNFGKIQIKNLIKFCDLVIKDLNSYKTYKQSNRAKPKKKPVPVTKLVEKLKYLKEFNDLELKSVSPTKIHEAQEMFVYDTSKRKLHYYKADQYSGGLSVKGTTIIGFSADESFMKTLRKPKEQLKEFMKSSKPNSRKFIQDIKAVDTKLTGRFNENIVILKVF